MEAKDNLKFNAIIKLGLWLVFITFLLIVINFGGQKKADLPNKKPKQVTLTLNEKMQKLDNNYSYVYEIKIADNMYYFKGSTKDKKEVGVKTFNSETTNYFKENNYIYAVNNGGLDKIDNLYEGINMELLDITNLKNMLNEVKYQENNNSYIYNLEDKVITVYSDNLNITRINISMENAYYDLSFYDIGLVTEIKY